MSPPPSPWHNTGAPPPSPSGRPPPNRFVAAVRGGSVVFTLGMTALLVAIQVYASTLRGSALEGLFLEYALIPARFTLIEDMTPAALLTFLSHAMLHANWQHLIFNVYALIAFGLIVERTLGVGRTLVVYIASALAGALLFVVLHPQSFIFLVGASGAISGLFGAALLVAPAGMRKTVMSNAVIWFALNVVVPALASLSGGNIAWEAHLGGFVAGAAIAWAIRTRAPYVARNVDGGGTWSSGHAPRHDGGDRNNPGKATVVRPAQPKKQDGPVIRR